MYSHIVLGIEYNYHTKKNRKRCYVPQSFDFLKKIGFMDPPLAYVPSYTYERSIPLNIGAGIHDTAPVSRLSLEREFYVPYYVVDLYENIHVGYRTTKEYIYSWVLPILLRLSSAMSASRPQSQSSPVILRNFKLSPLVIVIISIAFCPLFFSPHFFILLA